MLPLLFFFTATLASALTQFEVVDVVDNFAKQFLYPNNIKVAKSINSTLWAEDVKGSIDLSSNFDGRQLATEYVFGLFVVREDEQSPSLFGIPVHYNISMLIVQHHTVAAGLKLDFWYPTLNKTLPCEIDLWMNINEQRQVQEYDVVFRRWSWFTEGLIPQMVPSMAQWLNITGDAAKNESFVFEEFLATETCNTAIQHCTGDNKQYDSYQQCREFMASIPPGELYQMGSNSVACRYLHRNMVPQRPEVHCSHVGPSGGDMCINHKYEDVVRDNHFPIGFIAPKQETPENKFITDTMAFDSSYQPDGLLAISMYQQDYSHSWEPSQFGIVLFGFWLVLWSSAKAVYAIYHAVNPQFRSLSDRNRTNVTMYVLNIFYTTVALALQLASSIMMAGKWSIWAVRCIRMGGAMICALYCFELSFRFDMRWPLIVHHFITIISISMCVATMEYTLSTTFIVSGILWLFQATTEQSIFLGLMGYRLNWNKSITSRILKASAIQALVLKTASAIGLVIWWGLKQRGGNRPFVIGWDVVVWVCSVGLLATQCWGSWVTYTIGRRVERQMRYGGVANEPNGKSLSASSTDSGPESPTPSPSPMPTPNLAKTRLHESKSGYLEP